MSGNMFETHSVARSTRDQEDELSERSAELLEEVALQMVVLGTALIGAFLGLLIFLEIPLRLLVDVRLMVTAVLSLLFVAMLFSLPVLLPGKEIDLARRIQNFAFGTQLCAANITLVVWQPGRSSAALSSCCSPF